MPSFVFPGWLRNVLEDLSAGESFRIATTTSPVCYTKTQDANHGRWQKILHKRGTDKTTFLHMLQIPPKAKKRALEVGRISTASLVLVGDAKDLCEDIKC